MLNAINKTNSKIDIFFHLFTSWKLSTFISDLIIHTVIRILGSMNNRMTIYAKDEITRGVTTSQINGFRKN
jgi:hypothetical protein